MARLTEEMVAENALKVQTYDCPAHEDCTITQYTTAEAAWGGKAHRYIYTVHSNDGRLLTSSRPYCGSRNHSTSGHGSFVNAVTCNRC